VKPTLGRIVIYRQPENEEPVNTQREHPAIITTVFTERCVNLCVFFDAAWPQPVTSVELIEPHTDDAAMGWRWPERT